MRELCIHQTGLSTSVYFAVLVKISYFRLKTGKKSKIILKEFEAVQALVLMKTHLRFYPVLYTGVHCIYFLPLKLSWF